MDVQLHAVNAMLLEAIDEILAERSDAVIVLFSDHGGRMPIPGDEVHHSFLAARTPATPACLPPNPIRMPCCESSARRIRDDGRRPLSAGPLILFAAVGILLADAIIVWIGPRDFAFDFTCCYQQAAARALTIRRRSTTGRTPTRSATRRWARSSSCRSCRCRRRRRLGWLFVKVACSRSWRSGFGRTWPADRRVLVGSWCLPSRRRPRPRPRQRQHPHAPRAPRRRPLAGPARRRRHRPAHGAHAEAAPLPGARLPRVPAASRLRRGER